MAEIAILPQDVEISVTGASVTPRRPEAYARAITVASNELNTRRLKGFLD